MKCGADDVKEFGMNLWIGGGFVVWVVFIVVLQAFELIGISLCRCSCFVESRDCYGMTLDKKFIQSDR